MRVDSLLKDLGSGAEGFVFPSKDATAIKVFTHRMRFEKELAAYSRLAELDIIEVLGFSIPKLISYDARLLVIEMTIVQPPFLLDFAQATIDEPFEFEAGQEQEWWSEVEDAFGEHFSIAQDVFYALERIAGIYYYDLKPRNLNFGD